MKMKSAKISERFMTLGRFKEVKVGFTTLKCTLPRDATLFESFFRQKFESVFSEFDLFDAIQQRRTMTQHIWFREKTQK